jgi:hypothetical protein
MDSTALARAFAPIEGADPDDPNDILWGAKAIAEKIKKTPKAVYEMHAKGKLEGAVRNFPGPGGELVGSRRALLRKIFGIV